MYWSSWWSAQPYLLSADQVPKNFHPLDSNHQALMDPQYHVRAQSTSTQILLASNSQVTFQLLTRLQSSNQVLPAGNSQEIFLLLNDGIPASNVPIDNILNCCTYEAHQGHMDPWLHTLPTEHVDSSKLPVSYAMVKSNKCQVSVPLTTFEPKHTTSLQHKGTKRGWTGNWSWSYETKRNVQRNGISGPPEGSWWTKFHHDVLSLWACTGAPGSGSVLSSTKNAQTLVKVGAADIIVVCFLSRFAPTAPTFRCVLCWCSAPTKCKLVHVGA